MEISSILSNAFGKAERSTNRLADDFDTFLTLLTTQLQAQDPLDPLDSNEFTKQLVAFTGVEQQIQANKNLENLTALTAFNGMNAAVGFIGKEVTIGGDEAFLDDQPVTWLYELPTEAFASEVSILDQSGRAVVTFDGETARGTHAFTWNGIDENGQPVSRGLYRFAVKAKDVADAPVRANVFLRGPVEGVEMERGEALFTVSGIRASITEVLAVSLPESDNGTNSGAGDPAA